MKPLLVSILDELAQLVSEVLPELPVSDMGLLRGVPYGYLYSGAGDYRLGFDSTLFIHCSRGPSGPWGCGD